MPSAFSTTNTQEADGAEIVALGQAKSATRLATEINVSLQRNFTKTRIGIQLAIVIHGALFIATGAAMIKANEYYRQQSIIDQEVAHVARR
ncbi:hypothetical protein [Agrobacterium tumefaciens]|uniref:hypothetical protein n=1 Tax=Agrobacterium tumefaciens TaxID=358 RepID=UPI001659D96E|nr:hypothetical protein [Agrobacterium tumefaciens]QNP81013.1 hypothetical protein IAI05_07190 [Agrobacterium tumefaciens]